ncbi:type IV secretory system conjugative DNA transfer family protein [Stakelama tenebrarum]|uniref:Type IV secretory system conjugative DNA transfer family protein n=1 Tax=Stakelama tenebrarum TaxID=2711215 RepID=A0A6G6Y3P9_9SPHN|nr:type IV secretory system conjugative DNA transfer family protein [Sphingosinithalassobacter tenebrarum]QIG79437.1 type IV secretory system conjugative DNA transfer family protein [Sphingosinithalassobacter tenebrarum]
MSDFGDERFGSARWAEDEEIARAGLFGKTGFPIGYSGNRLMRLDSDSPGLIVAGAGAGKSRDVLMEAIIRCVGQRLWVLDPRGELAAVTIHNFAAHGAYAYCWNPVKLHAHILPSHRLNPLDILNEADPRFHADCGFIAAALIPLSGSSNGHYFELRARQWLELLIKSLVEQHGKASFPMLRDVLNAIEGDALFWDAQLRAMEDSKHHDIRAGAAEIWHKQKDVPKEFGAILGTIKGQLGFLNDPTLMDSLDEPDFSLADLVNPHQVASLFVNVPMEYVSIWSSLLRVLFTVSRLYKGRAPDAPRLTMIVDEAGQMGRFESLLSAFTFGRGEGVRTFAVFQDVGQIIRNFGAATLQSFIGSAQLRMFFGVRDYQTAQLVSNMLGNQSLRYDDPLKQEGARRQQQQALSRFLFEGDASAAFDYAHYRKASKHESMMQRALMTPDEILAMPEDRMIEFISGLDLPPIYATKRPHFEQRDLNGKWLPNPFHPPADRVKLPGLIGSKWVRVMAKDVPAHLAHFPQHQSGRLHHVDGYA